LTYTKPKPLLPLAGEPAIAHLIRKLAREGVDEIVVTTNYFANQLRTALGDGSTYGLRIHHVEENTPLGTAGSVKNAQSLINDTFLVIQGDSQFEFGLKEAVKVHRSNAALATLALLEVEKPWEYGIAELSGSRVTKFFEKPTPERCFSNLINTGIYVLEPEVLRLIPEGKPFDFSKNLFPMMLESKMTIAGFRATGFWVDIGDPRSYLIANIWALDRLKEEGNRPETKIVRGSGSSISEDATLNGPVHIGKNVNIEKDVTVGPYVSLGDGCEISSGAKAVLSAVYENTMIGAEAMLDTCIVAEYCKIGQRVQVERHSIVGAGTELRHESHLAPESRVGPWTIVDPRARVEGTVTAFENSIERICQRLERSSTSLGLTSEEARLCGALCELGEANAKTVARFARVSQERVSSILLDLEKRGVVASFGDIPKMYSLTKEEARPSLKQG
jgi:NDP-sugar pyrophosphorylase family protein